MSPALSLFLYHLRNRSKYPPGWRDLEKRTKAAHPWCAFCGQKEDKPKGIILQVHHIQPIHLHPELALEPTNVIVLCAWDHFHEGHVSDYNKGWDGDIAPRALDNITHIRLIQTDEGVKP